MGRASGFVAGRGPSAAEHVRETGHRAKDQSGDVNPGGVQPVVEQLAEAESEQDRGRDDEANLGITRERNQGIGFVFGIAIVGHDEVILLCERGFRGTRENNRSLMRTSGLSSLHDLASQKTLTAKVAKKFREARKGNPILALE